MATIVMHSITKEKISGTCCYEWSVTEAHRTRSGELYMRSMLVKRPKAQQIIEERGLVEAYSTREGTIYDTPDGAFKALFPYGLRNKFDIEQIEKTDRI